MSAKENKDNNNEFNKTAMDYMPGWAWAVCAILLSVSLSIRQIGLDITTPLNRIMSAYAVRIEEGKADFPHEKYNEILRRLDYLESVSHSPSGKNINSAHGTN